MNPQYKMFIVIMRIIVPRKVPNKIIVVFWGNENLTGFNVFLNS